MTVSINTVGTRLHAVCDGTSADGACCNANVIDLPEDRAAAGRIIRAFFGWGIGTRTVDGDTRPLDFCPACRPPAPRKPTRWPRGYREARPRPTTEENIT
jgi:hypothetical protein